MLPGLQLMPDMLVVPSDQRSTVSVADDMRYCRQTHVRFDKYLGAVPFRQLYTSTRLVLNTLWHPQPV